MAALACAAPLLGVKPSLVSWPMEGHRVRDLGLPEGCLMVMIKRGGREMVPAGGTRLKAGDHITVFITGDAPESCTLVQKQAKLVE